MSASPSDISVLIVDDEPDLADLYAYRLQQYTTTTATTGEEALDQYTDSELDIDVVLLDRSLPDMSGETVGDELRAAGFNGALIMITGANVDLDSDSPFDAVLQKPLETDTLIDTISAELP